MFFPGNSMLSLDKKGLIPANVDLIEKLTKFYS